MTGRSRGPWLAQGARQMLGCTEPGRGPPTYVGSAPRHVLQGGHPMGVGHRGARLTCVRRIVQHQGTLHAQQGGRPQVIRWYSRIVLGGEDTGPEPPGPAPARPRTLRAAVKHMQSRLSANSPLIVLRLFCLSICLNTALSTDPNPHCFCN